jgi:hypothetical protein
MILSEYFTVNLGTLILASLRIFVLSGRSQWPCGLRHEPSSLARTLESWVRIPFKAWISVRVYSVFVLFCL